MLPIFVFLFFQPEGIKKELNAGFTLDPKGVYGMENYFFYSIIYFFFHSSIPNKHENQV